MAKKKTAPLRWFIRREVGPFRRYRTHDGWTNNRTLALQFDTKEEATAYIEIFKVTNFIIVQEAE